MHKKLVLSVWLLWIMIEQPTIVLLIWSMIQRNGMCKFQQCFCNIEMGKQLNWIRKSRFSFSASYRHLILNSIEENHVIGARINIPLNLTYNEILQVHRAPGSYWLWILNSACCANISVHCCFSLYCCVRWWTEFLFHSVRDKLCLISM